MTDRDLAVLNALLSFYPHTALNAAKGLIVFPSNAALSKRAHGMAESTLRRHLAALVRAGLVQRHDSPNGKRYARRNTSGQIDRAFGFDLSPLLIQATQILRAAERAEQAQDQLRRLREAAVLHLRDATKLVEFAQSQGQSFNWDELSDQIRLMQRTLRRKLDIDAVNKVKTAANTLLQSIVMLIKKPVETQEMSAKPVQNERHHSNSKTDILDSESAQTSISRSEPNSARPNDTPLPLDVVVKAAPDIMDFARDGTIDTWTELIHIAERIAPMMGIQKDVWQQAAQAMGPVQAAIVVACLLQRAYAIKQPGAYLRTLTTKAVNGAFSPGPMVMALLSHPEKQAA